MLSVQPITTEDSAISKFQRQTIQINITRKIQFDYFFSSYTLQKNFHKNSSLFEYW